LKNSNGKKLKLKKSGTLDLNKLVPIFWLIVVKGYNSLMKSENLWNLLSNGLPKKLH